VNSAILIHFDIKKEKSEEEEERIKGKEIR
jgi:hypothetical protein